MLNIQEFIFLASISFITGLSGSMSPGPMFVATVVWSKKRGSIAGPLVVLGHTVAEIPIILALLLGLSSVFESIEVRLLTGVLGGLFLVWSSLHLLKASTSNDEQLQLSLGRSSPMSRSPILAGLTTSVLNPYFFIWWMTIGIPYATLSLETASYIGVAIFTCSHWISDLIWFSLVSFSVSRGRKVISNRVYRVILGVCGVLLMVLGGLSIIDSVRIVLAGG